MAVGLVGLDGQAGVEEQDAAIGPGREEAAVLGRGLEVGIIFLESGVHVLQAWRGGCWRTDGEAETVGLVDVVVGVLAEDDGFDGWEGCVTGPVSISGRNHHDHAVHVTYQLYTSCDGGKTFLPDSTSFFRNLLSSRKVGVTTSSFRAASQLSCSVLISSAKSSFCSGVSLATQVSLSNFTACVSGAVGEEAG